MQNSSLGVVLATSHFTSGLVALPPAMSAVIMNIMGSSLGFFWRFIDPSSDSASSTKVHDKWHRNIISLVLALNDFFFFSPFELELSTGQKENCFSFAYKFIRASSSSRWGLRYNLVWDTLPRRKLCCIKQTSNVFMPMLSLAFIIWEFYLVFAPNFFRKFKLAD